MEFGVCKPKVHWKLTVLWVIQYIFKHCYQISFVERILF